MPCVAAIQRPSASPSPTATTTRAPFPKRGGPVTLMHVPEPPIMMKDTMDAKLEDTRVRCGWARTPLMVAYHDTEWGVAVHDDRILFEFLTLERSEERRVGKECRSRW